MVQPTKEQIQAFEARIDAERGRRAINRYDANAALLLAFNMVEAAAAVHLGDASESMLADGICSFAPFLVSGTSGAEPDIAVMVEDLVFGFHYHYLRDLLYYSYNAPEAIDWTFGENSLELRFHDRSIPRQFFTAWNEHVFLSERTFEGFAAPDEIKRLLTDQPEFDLDEVQHAVDPLLQEHADRKLAAYFSILGPATDIDLGGYSYREFYKVYRVLMMKALYHRYQASVNENIGCVLLGAHVLRDMLTAETGVPARTVALILQDLVYDKTAVRDRVDASYFSLFREGAAPHRIMMRPSGFSKAEGLVGLLRVVAQRRPNVFLSNVSNMLGAQFVQRVKSAFESQGFLCRAHVSLRPIHPELPDIDLLVIAEEPTLGFVMLICEVKSPIPPCWAKDQLRALAPDNVSKAFRQTEAIGAFLQTAPSTTLPSEREDQTRQHRLVRSSRPRQARSAQGRIWLSSVLVGVSDRARWPSPTREDGKGTYTCLGARSLSQQLGLGRSLKRNPPAKRKHLPRCDRQCRRLDIARDYGGHD